MTLTLKYMAKALLLAFVAVAAYVVLTQLFGIEADAQNTEAARDGLKLTGEPTTDAEGSLGTIVKAIINVLSIIVGAVSVIMIIIGGLKYVVSSGDASGIQSAKNTIIYALVGLVIVIFAQVIVAFVIERVNTPGGAPAAGYVLNIG